MIGIWKHTIALARGCWFLLAALAAPALLPYEKGPEHLMIADLVAHMVLYGLGLFYLLRAALAYHDPSVAATRGFWRFALGWLGLVVLSLGVGFVLTVAISVLVASEVRLSRAETDILWALATLTGLPLVLAIFGPLLPAAAVAGHFGPGLRGRGFPAPQLRLLWRLLCGPGLICLGGTLAVALTGLEDTAARLAIRICLTLATLLTTVVLARAYAEDRHDRSAVFA